MRNNFRMLFVAAASAALALCIALPALAESGSAPIGSCAVEPVTVVMPQDAVVSVKVGDSSGIALMTCVVSCRYAVDVVNFPMEYSAASGLWTAVITLPDYLSEGAYNVSISAFGNEGLMFTQEFEDILYVLNDHADTVLPRYVSSRLEPVVTSVPASVSVSAEAADDNGVVYFYCDAFMVPGVEYGCTYLEYNAETKRWEGTLALPADMPAGSYAIAYTLYDSACNMSVGTFAQTLTVSGN